MSLKINITYGEPESHRTFDELLNLLYFAFSDLNYQVQITHKVIDFDGLNVIVGIHQMPSEIYSALPQNTIVVNTESLRSYSVSTDVRKLWFERIMESARYFHFWDYSLENLHFLNHYGIKHGQYLQLGYQKELQQISSQYQIRDIDVLFYGGLSERRAAVLQALEARGLKVKYLRNVWGEERNQWIARSKIVLNMHFEEGYSFESVRCFYLMTNGVAIVSEENVHLPIDMRYRNGVVAVPYEQLVEACVILCRNDALLAQQRQLAVNTISAYPQSQIVHQLLHQISL